MGKRILVVGCGITGAITAKLLRSKFENISIWEKYHDFGGRFNTVTGGKHNDLTVDLGAQYITTTDDTIKKYNDVYTELFSNSVLVTMENNKVKGMKQPLSNTKNFIAPFGMKYIVKSILDGVNCSITFGRKLTALYRNVGKWQVLSECGKREEFDVVILTIPVPEIVKLYGDLGSILADNKDTNDKLKAVKYSSRYALGIFFEESLNTDVDSEYIDNDPILRFIAYDSWKNNNYKNIFRSAVVHSTIQFGEVNGDKNLEEVKNIVIKHLTEDVFPHWPKPSSVTAHYWKYSQVLQPFCSKPGVITILNDPLLIAGGDGFIGSTFDNCIYSAKEIVDIVLKHYNYS